MSKTIEVFADVTCPFTHVGLSRVAERVRSSGSDIEIRVRAWPLEWVNGSPLEANAVAIKAAALRHELAINLFAGTDTAHWPSTTIPALNLVAAAYETSPALGLAVSLDLRNALFERGLDISNPAVLATLAEAHRLAAPDHEPSRAVIDDYDLGKIRGVKGSPDFFTDDHEFFCPALDLGHDKTGQLTAQFDVAGLETFMSTVMTG